MKLSTLFSVLAVALVATGCSTVDNTNRFANVAMRVGSSDTLANIEVGEKVAGTGCAHDYLVIFKTGDNKFIRDNSLSTDSPLDRAKAAAAYKALTTEKGLSTDILVHPVWEVSTDRILFGLISDDTCAKVVGYRGVIKSFKQAESATLTNPPEPKFRYGSFFDAFK
jgi:hypothetical protein